MPHDCRDTYLESLGFSYVSEDYSTAEGYLNSQGVADALDTYFGWTEGDDRISPNAAVKIAFSGKEDIISVAG